MLPHMAEEGRIFLTSSDMYDAPGGNMVWEGTEALAHPNEKSAKDSIRYSYSKLCNLYFTYGLARRLCNSGKKLYVNAFNPGLMKTNSTLITVLRYRALPARLGRMYITSLPLSFQIRWREMLCALCVQLG